MSTAHPITKKSQVKRKVRKEEAKHVLFLKRISIRSLIRQDHVIVLDMKQYEKKSLFYV